MSNKLIKTSLKKINKNKNKKNITKNILMLSQNKSKKLKILNQREILIKGMEVTQLKKLKKQKINNIKKKITIIKVVKFDFEKMLYIVKNYKIN